MRRVLFAMLLALLSCAPRIVYRGDAAAEAGDWERALAEYRAENATDRLPRAEREVAALFVSRGDAAMRAARCGDAGNWWRQAAALDPESDGARRIRRQLVELDACANAALAGKRWRDARAAFEAILHVRPLLADATRGAQEARRGLGKELHRHAAKLEKRGLDGAAYATDLAALQHDPLQPDAFPAAKRLRRELTAASHLQVQGIRIADQGAWGLADALVSRLEERLLEEPPLGPTRKKPSVAGKLTVTIEEFTWWDEATFGIERRRMDGNALALVLGTADRADIAADLVPNPEYDAREWIASQSEEEFERLQSIIRAEPPGKKEKRAPIPPRTPDAAVIDALQAEIETRRAAVGRVAATLPRGDARAAWILPWREQTRTATARIRLELHETGRAEPDVYVVEKSARISDRTHPGSALHEVAPDPLVLPSLREVEASLAEELLDGVDALGKARERRAARHLVRGREAAGISDLDAAVDAFVHALFLVGPDKLPDDAATAIAARVEHDRLRVLVTGPP